MTPQEQHDLDLEKVDTRPIIRRYITPTIETDFYEAFMLTYRINAIVEERILTPDECVGREATDAFLARALAQKGKKAG